MFDKLLILDVGGYPIYNGNPVDAVMYFKDITNHAKSNESECHVCGNVNPEQIFNIIESKVVDEYGTLTQHRKVSPKEWNDYYLDKLEKDPTRLKSEDTIPESTFKKPSIFKQLGVFFVRDVLSKLTNKQYLIINLLEAPLLAFVLSFFVKFYNGSESGIYSFNENQNIPSFLFIAVIVALFIGLTVAAEEIIKDQKILKRESFLNLSKGSYLVSKITIMFIISGIQMLLFVVVGNLILEIKGMWLEYWVILFSLSCFANLLGLNISASFNSVKVIYILIPILIIPQLLFSGVIVKFDKLHPMFGDESSVPLIGNVMASRWAYEALAVTQFKENEHSKIYFELEKNKSFATWKKDYWLQELTAELDFVKTNISKEEKSTEVKNTLQLIHNEIAREHNFIQNLKCQECLESLTVEKYNEDTYNNIRGYFGILRTHYKGIVDSNRKKIDNKTKEIIEKYDKETYLELVKNHTNKSLTRFVTNKNDLNKLVKTKDRIVQKGDPIYLDPYDVNFFESHFYAPRKRFFGGYISTFAGNLLVIWGMSIFLIITLYFDLLKKLLDAIEKVLSRIPFAKKD